jgi:GntR family transcriptional repressor for pyruvate dehydrogenase complex
VNGALAAPCLSDSRTATLSTVQLTRVENKTSAEIVRAQLIQLIQSGSIAVDARLPSEAELARSFGVSRSVIREALHSLNALGLTRSFAGKGTFVSSAEITSGLLTGLYRPFDLNEVRQSLEVPAARLAAGRRADGDLQRMVELLADFDATVDAGLRVKVDADFHLAIAVATGNPLFPRLIGELRSVLQEQALVVSAVPGRAAVASAEHRAIYEAIAAGEAEAAADAMGRHLLAVISMTDPT